MIGFFLRAFGIALLIIATVLTTVYVRGSDPLTSEQALRVFSVALAVGFLMSTALTLLTWFSDE